MKEIKDILQAYDQAERDGKRSALATVVHVEGSSYRRPGARMLVTEDGRLTGAISGGCLEGDALQKALLAIHQWQNKLVIYDTTDEDDLRFGVQLGCNGVVHILFEPIDRQRPDNAIQLLRELVRERREAVLVTLFSPDRSLVQPGTSLLYTADGVKANLSAELRALVMGDVEVAYREKRSCFEEYAGEAGVSTARLNGFIEFLPPPPALVIAGAGNDVVPLVEIVTLLGWHVTVVDGRPHHATRERFPKADRVLVARAKEVLGQLHTDLRVLCPGSVPTCGAGIADAGTHAADACGDTGLRRNPDCGTRVTARACALPPAAAASAAVPVIRNPKSRRRGASRPIHYNGRPCPLASTPA